VLFLAQSVQAERLQDGADVALDDYSYMSRVKPRAA
jgi:hypothetical protein